MDCPGYWAEFATENQAEPNPVEADPADQPSKSYRDQPLPVAGDCDFETRSDYPHRSNNPPGSASVHGWWNATTIYDCPEEADVWVSISALWCIYSSRPRCFYRTLDINEDRVEARNLGGARVNARHPCTSSTSWYRYRSIVDVDLVGEIDGSDTESETKDLQCRPDD